MIKQLYYVIKFNLFFGFESFFLMCCVSLLSLLRFFQIFNFQVFAWSSIFIHYFPRSTKTRGSNHLLIIYYRLCSIPETTQVFLIFFSMNLNTIIILNESNLIWYCYSFYYVFDIQFTLFQSDFIHFGYW